MSGVINANCKTNADCNSGLICNSGGICCANSSFNTKSDGSACCVPDDASLASDCAIALCNNNVQCASVCNDANICCDTCAQGCENVTCTVGRETGKCLNNSCCTGKVVNGQCCASGTICAGSCVLANESCCLGQIICGPNTKCCQKTNGGNPMTNGCDPAFGQLGGPICVPSNRDCHEYGACST